MPRYVIERELPGAHRLSDDELTAISQKSNLVLTEMPEVQWDHSYVAEDKIYCVYVAPDSDLVREHATRGGFPGKRRRAGRARDRPDHRRPLT